MSVTRPVFLAPAMSLEHARPLFLVSTCTGGLVPKHGSARGTCTEPSIYSLTPVRKRHHSCATGAGVGPKSIRFWFLERF